MSWYLLPSPNGYPSLSATFARSLGIEENDEIFITCESESPSLTSVIVTPKSIQDQEILVRTVLEIVIFTSTYLICF